jgi:formylglycine-generating enzyme required for sulfatase activity
MTTAVRQVLPIPTGGRIAQLRVAGLLGSSATACVYLATDALVQRQFVLKEYLPQQTAMRRADGQVQPADAQAATDFEQGKQYFLAQGRMLAGLEHANIVVVQHCFEANGTAYLQMPYLPGATLATLVERDGTFDATQIKSLLLPLLDALDYLHRNGVIHQDIKPSNIYLTDAGTPLLLDFGASGSAQQPLAGRMGSPGYAAPEQDAGVGAVGPWTDIYGLAACLYRLASNRLPVPARQRLEAVQQGMPDPLAGLAPSRAQAIPPPWVHAVMAGLALAPARRPQSVAEWMRSFEEDFKFVPNVAVPKARRSVLAATPAPPPGDIAVEGRAWLPMALLGVFAVGLLVLLYYLLIAGPGDGDGSGTEAAGEAVRPGSETTQPRDPELNLRWQQALEADTIFAYQRFRQDYPNSIHEQSAVEHLAQLDDELWQRSDTEGTRSAYESYLEQLPQGRHEAEAMIRLEVMDRTAAEEKRQQDVRAQEDNLAWNEARMQRNIAALDKYMAAFPDGRHLAEAQALRRELSDAANDSSAFAAAQKLNTRKSYQAYIDAFPRGQHVTEALTAIDGLALRPGKRFRDCDDCPDLVVLASGSYWQGAEEDSKAALANEKPMRKVVLQKPLAIGIHEVTMAQWQVCVAGGACQPVNDNGWGGGARPVMMVSWNDAQGYLEWLSKKTGQRYRLPSESEWEYAARAGDTTEWPDDNPAGVCTMANLAGSETGFRWAHNACSDAWALETAPVGSLLSNMFGLHDALGNVAEWTADCMSLSYADAPADGTANSRGLCNSRVTRGGSWFSGARESRLSARFNLKAGDRNDFTGFRVVRELPDES